jgi:two-component system LytT family sensor kinase
MEMVTDYVEIHRHRIDPDRAEIKLEMKGESQGCKIAPMLLIPFIENSFKHGLQGSPRDAFVHIKIEVDSCKFQFQIKNNLGESDALRHNEKKGIGIENTRQRLELLYPGKHSLSIGKKDKSFVVKLALDLND